MNRRGAVAGLLLALVLLVLLLAGREGYAPGMQTVPTWTASLTVLGHTYSGTVVADSESLGGVVGDMVHVAGPRPSLQQSLRIAAALYPMIRQMGVLRALQTTRKSLVLGFQQVLTAHSSSPDIGARLRHQRDVSLAAIDALVRLLAQGVKISVVAHTPKDPCRAPDGSYRC